jgi:hypothetical protein
MASKIFALLLLCNIGAQAASVFLAHSADLKDAQSSANAVEKQGVMSALAQKVKMVRQNPQEQKAEQEGGSGFLQRMVMQIIFGVVYYFIVVTKYPKLDECIENKMGNDKARELQQMDPVSATFSSKMRAPAFLCSWACTGPRAAHTFHSTGLMNYWVGLVLMSCFPCCTLWFTNSFCDLNVRLQGEKQDPLSGCLCAWCCSCCMVAQDAQSLDYITGYNAEICGVTRS